MAKRKANIEANQSLHDLAMQAYGNPEGYWQLAQDNDLDDPTQELEVGGELSFLETTSPIQEDYIRRGRRVATGRTPKPDGAFACAFAPGFNQRGCVFVQDDFNLELDGVNDFGKANGNDLTVWNLGTSAYTISFWGRIDDLSTKNCFYAVMADSTPSVGDFEGLMMLSLETPTKFELWGDAGAGSPIFEYDVSMIAGEWNHYTIVRLASDPLITDVYKDGTKLPKTLKNFIDPDFQLDKKLRLGGINPNKNPVGGQRWLNGAMTEFIAQKKEISAQEITDRANNLGISDTQNVIAWHALDQTSGGTVSDLSGNGNDIDLQGYTSAELAGGGGAWVEFDPNP